MDFSIFGGGDIGTLALGLVIAGVVAGLAAGSLGVGGGLVLIPALFVVFADFGVAPDLRLALAVGTGLAAMLPSAVMLLMRHHRERELDLPAWRRAAPFAGLGAGIGAAAIVLAPWQASAIVYSVFAAAVAFLLFWAKPERNLRRLQPGLAFGMLLGAVGGFTGIGASALATPLGLAGGTAPRRAAAQGAGLDVVIGIVGALVLAVLGWNARGLPAHSYGFVNLACFAVAGAAMFLTASITVSAAKQIDAARLSKVFALYVLFCAGKMVWAVWG